MRCLLGVGIIMATLTANSLRAQAPRTAAAPASFEVASVKLSGGDARFYSMAGSDPSQISWKTFSMQEILKRAYGVKAYQIEGPAWLATQGYDIMAKFPSGGSPEQLPQMLQNLLKERFKMECHEETRELAVYGLAIAKGALKAKESSGPAPPPPVGPLAPPKLQTDVDGYPKLRPGNHTGMTMLGNGKATASFKRESMQQLVDFLTGETGHPVLDMTGLRGLYDFNLTWISQRPGLPSENSAAASEPGASIYVALERQAGLKLEQRKAPVQMIVIDHIEKVPTAN